MILAEWIDRDGSVNEHGRVSTVYKPTVYKEPLGCPCALLGATGLGRRAPGGGSGLTGRVSRRMCLIKGEA
jgi:hypothetical protein